MRAPHRQRLRLSGGTDCPGFGASDVLPTASFIAYGQAISELLDRLAIGPLYIYLHDFGAPVGFQTRRRRPRI